MRRPHVYERSAPRAGRNAASRLPDDDAATLHLRRLIDAALRDAETLGLDRVVAALEEARSAAAEPHDAGPDVERRPESP